MPEIKNAFIQGKMNKDLDERLVPSGQYRDAMNIQVTTSDSSDVGVAQNISGNQKMDTGLNSIFSANAICVGAIADEKNNKIYYFVHDGSILDAIVEFDGDTNTLVLIDENQDVLLFDGSIVTGINVIDGLLYFTDGKNEPKKVNIETSKAGTTTTHTQIHNRDIEEKDITVIKKKPTKAPLLNYSTKIRDGYLGWQDSTTEQYYGIIRDRNVSNYSPGDEGNVFMEIEVNGEAFDYRVGDSLIMTLLGDPIPTTGSDEQAVVIVKEVFPAVGPNYSSYTNTGWRQRLIITIQNISPSIAVGSNDWTVVLKDAEITINDRKFFRFSTRYKYTDREYSAFGPWTDVAFLASNYLYAPTKEPYNLGMQNAAKSIILSAFAGGDTPEDVEEIDILYKEENSSTVYVVDTLKKDDPVISTPDFEDWGHVQHNNWTYPIKEQTPHVSGTGFATDLVESSYTGKFIVTTQNIISALPKEQLLRTWDNVPIKALAQEIVANRLIYGNYTKNYSLDTKPILNCQIINNVDWPGEELDPGYIARGRSSIKTLREYQIGVLFSDDYGRETPVFTNDTASITTPFHFNHPKQISAFIKSFNPPNWASYYKFYIKETSGEYYNLAMDRAYLADKDKNLWISFPSSDRNKVSEDDYLILKKPLIKDPLSTGIDDWEIGVGEGIKFKNKYKIIDIQNEAPQFIKSKFYSMGSATNNSSNDLEDHLFQGPDHYPKAGRRNLSIDKYYWHTWGWKNQDLFPDDKGIEENVLAIQFSKPGVAPGTTILSKRYEILSVTLNTSSTNLEDPHVAVTSNDEVYYRLQLKDPIEDNDSWVQSGVDTIEDDLIVEIFKVEQDNLQEFEGRFFVKIMGDELTRTYIESRVGENFLTVASTEMLVLTDTSYITSGTGTTTNANTFEYLNAGSTGWANLLYAGFSQAGMTGGFFIDATHFAAGQTTANNSIGCSGIMTGTPTDVISYNTFNTGADADRDDLESGIYGGIYSPSGYKWSAGSQSDLSDMGERSFRTLPQELLTPVGESPTAQLGSRRYIYSQNKYYMNLSFSGCGMGMASETENFPVTDAPTGSNADLFHQFKASECGPLHTTTTDWVKTYTVDSAGGDITKVYDLDGSSDMGWIRFPNYTHGTISASPFDTILWPNINPDNLSPINYYNSASKGKWKALWDPTKSPGGLTVQARKDFVDQLKPNSRFYFSQDPSQTIYTILDVDKLRFYNHTSFRTTWIKSSSGSNADDQLIKRHLESGYFNNSVEEALLVYLNDPSGAIDVDIDGNAMDMEGSTTRLEYLQKMVHRFGARNNRRVTYVLELDQDPTNENWYPTQDITDATTLSNMIFVNENLADDDPGLPDSPAVWETEPKEQSDLDIYYEASDNIPLEINKNTRELLAPGGSKIWHMNMANTGAVPEPEDWTHTNLQGSSAMPVITKWANPSSGPYNGDEDIFNISSSYISYISPTSGYPRYAGSGATPLPIANYLSSTWLVAEEGFNFTTAFEDGNGNGGWFLRLDKKDGSFVTVKVVDVRVKLWTMNWFLLQYIYKITQIKVENTGHHEYSTGLKWWNCIDFGNGVESDRIRDDFNEMQITDGIKASTTTIQKYEQETKKNGLIFSSIYNPIGKINGFNEFITANKITKELSPTYGSIQKLFTRDNDLLSFCEDKVIRIYADKDVLYNADGNPQLIASNRVLGQSDPFEGEFGISQDPASFASESFRVYFTDRNRNSVLRLSKDGITRISDYGMIDYFGDNMSSGDRLLGSFDYNKQEYNLACFKSELLSFSEAVKGWVSFKSFGQMEYGLSMSGNYYTFYQGTPYLHHVEDEDKNTFYGTHTSSKITAILNESPNMIKSFKTLFYDGTQSKIIPQTSDKETSLFGEYYNLEAQDGWYVNSISTNNNTFTYNVESVFEFKNKEGKWSNHIRGSSIEEGGQNFNLSNFNFQGIGEKITSIL